MTHILHHDQVVVVRQLSTGLFAAEDDAGGLVWSTLGPRTILLDPEDEETIAAHLSAAPGGSEAAEAIRLSRRLSSD